MCYAHGGTNAECLINVCLCVFKCGRRLSVALVFLLDEYCTYLVM